MELIIYVGKQGTGKTLQAWKAFPNNIMVYDELKKSIADQIGMQLPHKDRNILIPDAVIVDDAEINAFGSIHEIWNEGITKRIPYTDVVHTISIPVFVICTQLPIHKVLNQCQKYKFKNFTVKILD